MLMAFLYGFALDIISLLGSTLLLFSPNPLMRFSGIFCIGLLCFAIYFKRENLFDEEGSVVDIGTILNYAIFSILFLAGIASTTT